MTENDVEDILLFGKACNNHPRIYTIEHLQTIANKVGLATTRQDYQHLCDGLRTFFFENGITTEEELERYVPSGYTIVSEIQSRILGENTDLDILFNSNPDEFLHSVEYFQNLKNYNSMVKRLDTDLTNSNGFIYKLNYVASSKQIYSVILKTTQHQESDNLVYEYLVGQCIYEYSKYYPCFAKTYLIGMFLDTAKYNTFMRQSISKPLDTYIKPIDPRNIENLVINGCKFNEFLTLFTQYIPFKYNFNDYLKNFTYRDNVLKKWVLRNEFIFKLYEITVILHMVYQLLSSFADKFTHYDLHMENIILVEVPDNNFIHTVFHYPDGRVLHYNMCYIPVIIDYGHCFVNCKQINESLANSEEIMKIVCNNDSQRNRENPSCPVICGNRSGYHYSSDLDKTGTFTSASAQTNFIDYTRKNISHDCRLLHELLYYFDFDRLPKENFIVQQLVIGIFENLTRMDDRFGTHEDAELSGININNVIIAASKLTDIITQPKFNIYNDSLLAKKKLYGTLNIWTDLSRPFQFS